MFWTLLNFSERRHQKYIPSLWTFTYSFVKPVPACVCDREVVLSKIIKDVCELCMIAIPTINIANDTHTHPPHHAITSSYTVTMKPFQRTIWSCIFYSLTITVTLKICVLYGCMIVSMLSCDDCTPALCLCVHACNRKAILCFLCQHKRWRVWMQESEETIYTIC